LEKSAEAWNAWGVAEIYAVLGDKDSALKWLEQGYLQRHPYSPWIRVFHDFDSLRGDPRYAALLQKMNLSP
jgi:hypothetical protein